VLAPVAQVSLFPTLFFFPRHFRIRTGHNAGLALFLSVSPHSIPSFTSLDMRLDTVQRVSAAQNLQPDPQAKRKSGQVEIFWAVEPLGRMTKVSNHIINSGYFQAHGHYI
jgi:hypothetical protein